ncbi:arsenate reductase ArsC [Rhodospirillaceae bacterium KN72]|uniref:Arsenate reductase ArsC n=1 Tax=Pacificispira spongiicola TaxID=2729598 RepID=A0A7Y0E396_9PROT|nr:arsenate reductase ArsC [Pacificispira spongiicola]NMM46440.1 arsenate reductase ArsC [Pacificispira spongiicola]
MIYSADDLPDAVMFCCTMNSIRSPMAEGLMKQLHGNKVYVDSVGARSGELDGMMVQVMGEIGIDMSGHRSKTFDELEDTFFDTIVALSPEAQHHAVELTRTMACDVVFWNTFDPSIIDGSREQRLDAYRQVRDQIRQRILKTFPVE